MALAQPSPRGAKSTSIDAARTQGAMPPRSTRMPRADRSLDLGLALRAHEVVDGCHEVDRRSSFDRHGKRGLVMRFSRSERDHGSAKKSPHAIDHIAVGHADTNYRKTRLGRRPGKKRSFALEDSREPMEIGRVDAQVLSLHKRRVNVAGL